MNKKTTQIIVVVLCFAASGLVLYYGYFKPQAESRQLPSSILGVPGVVTPGAAQDEAILPLSKLEQSELNILKNINGDSYASKYPKFNPRTEVGIDVKDLIPPLQKTQE